MSEAAQEERQPPTPKAATPDEPSGNSGELDRVKAGYERRIAELTAEVRNLKGAAETASNALAQLQEQHAAELAKRDEAFEVVQKDAETARREAALVRHGIDDAEAQDFIAYEYGKQKPGEDGKMRAFSDWLPGYVESGPRWLQPYLRQQQKAAEPAPQIEVPRVEASAAAPAPPLKTNAGAGTIGGKGSPTLQEMMSWDTATYRAWAESNVRGGRG